MHLEAYFRCMALGQHYDISWIGFLSGFCWGIVGAWGLVGIFIH